MQRFLRQVRSPEFIVSSISPRLRESAQERLRDDAERHTSGEYRHQLQRVLLEELDARLEAVEWMKRLEERPSLD